ncbi:hypothetical protein F5877DRAFT_70026 [Lentinula edodes]|nr:hypothetical protein F5877DRAFT_70026 [Lentinula edodes]
MSQVDKSLPKISITEPNVLAPDDEEPKRERRHQASGRTNDTLQKDRLSKSQQTTDTNSEEVSDAITSAYDRINSFYSENQTAFAAVSGTRALVNLKDIEEAMSALIDWHPIIIRGLNWLSQLHPFIGIVTNAFSAVISMDVQRKKNNMKVIALMME